MARGRRGDDLAKFADICIPDIVDLTIFYLLNAIDNDRLRLLLKEDGGVCDLHDAGNSEMAGDYLGKEGWREKSRERFNDYFGRS